MLTTRLPAPAGADARRGRFLAQQVETATPAGLLVMLYDRLVVDLVRSEEALAGGDRGGAHTALVHAQEIVAELLSTLDTEAWDGAGRLAGLYTYLLRELVGANVARDAARVAACRGLVEPLRDAWREAAGAAPAGSSPAVA
ncbi:MAG: flagellar export chaperone FliS [Kineosporiaceae bacterium]